MFKSVFTIAQPIIYRLQFINHLNLTETVGSGKKKHFFSLVQVEKV